jgi:predicted ATPase
VGKIRLTGEVARRVAGRFADGAWLAELAAVRDPAKVPAVVAAALGAPVRCPVMDGPLLGVAARDLHAVARNDRPRILHGARRPRRARTPVGFTTTIASGQRVHHTRQPTR